MAQRTHDSSRVDRQQLPRPLEMSDLARAAPHLAPEVLQRLVRHAGLEHCVDLVEALGREQLTAVLDLDLWRAPLPGTDEQFDADRFGEWLEALVDRDAATGARVVARFDRSLVVTGLSRYIRVHDPGVLVPTETTDDEPSEPGVFAAHGFTAEVGGYIVQARREDAWDAVVALLVALSADQVECFHAVMSGCRGVSDAGREVDGLDDLLEVPEQLLHDVTIGRDDRREERGFGTAAEARAFLAVVRQDVPRPHANAIAAGWIRRADASAASPPAPVPRVESIVSHALDEIPRVLVEADLIRQPARGMLGGAASADTLSGALQPFMEYLRDRHPDVCLARGREMAFLANALVAGCTLQSRSFTPREAAQAVAATCSLGLLRQPEPPGLDYLVGHELIAIFQDGWAALQREVSLFVAEGLVAILRGVRSADSETLEGLHALRRSLEAHLASGAPWLACAALDVLAILDTPACYGLRGLLSECPVIPEAITAIVERRSGRIDPGAFAFIATIADIDTVRAFMARLPQLLEG